MQLIACYIGTHSPGVNHEGHSVGLCILRDVNTNFCYGEIVLRQFSDILV